jgi:hypothetical protein
VALAAILSVGFLFQGTWALAATTGGIAGLVNDDRGAPVAGATVTATSPSQVETTTTDAQGHFVFLTLAPDTYSISVSKSGYNPVSLAGESVFADQTQQVTIIAPRAIAVIAIQRTSATQLVKPGVGGDLYSVNAAQQQAASALGGGANLNNAYSAIASVPGVVVGTGGMGWNQAVIIHGSNPFFTGFEYDGVPVNRAFDNYTSSTESSLGLQELEVYTGGGPADIASNGTSGFINQVIKTGTYPGFATLEGGLATEAFYHQAEFEAGGASPDRNFSYYVGISGYNQAFRYIDQSNGASLMTPGTSFSDYSPFFTSNTGNATYSLCNASGAPTAAPTPEGTYSCLDSFFGLYGFESFLTDRENVVNLHLGVPRADGQRDDFQVLWESSAMQSFFNSSPNNLGPGYAPFTLAVTGTPYVAGANFPHYADAVTYNLPFGTNVDPGGVPLPYQYYYQPNSPTDVGYDAQLPNNQDDLFHNDVGLIKVQWNHPFNDHSYVRIYAYSLFTDWTEDGPTGAYGYDTGIAAISPNYLLITHTGGGAITYANQINDQNLVQLSGNYIQASTTRFNNTGYLHVDYGADFFGCGGGTNDLTTAAGLPYAYQSYCIGQSPVGLISRNSSGIYTCYNAHPSLAYPVPGSPVPCFTSNYKDGAFDNGNGTVPGITGAASAAGATWSTLWNGNASGTYNTVQPQFYNAQISDQLRPNDHLMINLALRFDDFDYNLAPSNTGQNPFYAQIVQNYACWSASNGTLTSPLGPGVFPPPAATLEVTCPAGYVHPNGVGSDPLFSLNTPKTYNMYFWEPRVSLTYTLNPTTVIRFSAGRYAEPPLTAAVQYLYQGGSGATLWANFMNAGFFSPFHPIAGQTSGQYDASFEHRFAGTNVSMKITPFYSTTSNWEQQSFIGAGFVTQIPVGRAENYGVEAALNFGNFAQNGFSGQISFTYTQSLVQFQRLLGESQIDLINQAVKNYNSLTHAGGGSPCYYSIATGPTATYPGGGVGGAPAACNGTTTIANPYYNLPMQSYFNTNGWYPQGELALGPGGVNNNPEFYNSPYVAALILNWRHDKLAITPSLQFEAGAPYGTPINYTGIDPRLCYDNSNQAGVTGVSPLTNPNQCDYQGNTASGVGVGIAQQFGYVYAPNPYTGKFDGLGEYNQPNIVIGNIQLTYDVSPKLRLQLTAADIFHTCFGGTSEPWTVANPPSSTICGYGDNGLYNGYAPGAESTGYYGYWEGTGPSDLAANGTHPYPWNSQMYTPGTGNGIGSYLPFNLYITAQIHL